MSQCKTQQRVITAGRSKNKPRQSQALPYRFVNAGSCLDQPDEALRVSPKSSDVGWGLCVTGGGDVQGGSGSHQLYQAFQLGEEQERMKQAQKSVH